MKKNLEREQRMVEMRMNGATYLQIAEAFGITKQRVQQIVGKRRGNNFRPFTEERCVYPILREWLNDNKISLAELCRMCRGNASSSNLSELRVVLRGESKWVTKPTIDKLINATWLTYEKLFYEGETT